MSQESASTSASAMDLVSSASNSPMASGTATHDESDQDEQPRKRARRSGRKSKKMAGFLAGIVHVPMDIFAQITSHLHPIDIHTLARTNKKFRKLLMNRSSRHIWIAAERNVPGLPPCPEYISNAGYAALVFGKWCSMCGTTTNVVRRMDEMLAVKLCNVCRDNNIIGVSVIAHRVVPFIRLSRAVKLPTTKDSAYGLMNEVNWVVSLVFDLATQGETATLERWKVERVVQLRKQTEFARALIPFLDALDDQRDVEIEELKAKRFAEIKERLMENGWEEIDCHVTHYPLLREWEKLVAVPKRLSNRIWENIKPKLEPILQENRRIRLIQERKQRREDRKTRLRKLIADIGTADPQTIELAEHPGVSLAVPFPKDERVLNLLVVRDILKQDVSGDVAEERFMTVKGEIEAELRMWRRSIAEQLAKKLKPALPGYAGLLVPVRRTHSPEPPVDLSTQFTPESQPYIQFTNITKLLRADSVFQVDSGDNSKCLFFPDVVVKLQDKYILEQQQRHWAYSDSEDDDFASSFGLEHYDHLYERPGALVLTGVHSHSRGIRAAKAILAHLGKPDAAHLEMKSLGKSFICDSCWVQKPMTWIEILEHWCQTFTYHWPYKTQVSLQEKGILCKEEHFGTISSEPGFSKPKVENSDSGALGEDGVVRPFVRLVTDEEIEALENDVSPRFLCGVCDSVSAMHEGRGLGDKPIPIPTGRKEVIREHLTYVHNIPAEKLERMILECSE